MKTCETVFLATRFDQRRRIAPSSINENEQSANFGTEREEEQRKKLIIEGFFADPEGEEGVSDPDRLPSRQICYL